MNQSVGHAVGWLVGRLVGWSVSWLVGCSVGIRQSFPGTCQLPSAQLTSPFSTHPRVDHLLHPNPASLAVFVVIATVVVAVVIVIVAVIIAVVVVAVIVIVVIFVKKFHSTKG